VREKEENDRAYRNTNPISRKGQWDIFVEKERKVGPEGMKAISGQLQFDFVQYIAMTFISQEIPRARIWPLLPCQLCSLNDAGLRLHTC
jgi:hypothetical protein